MSALRQSPLHERHLALGAKLAGFGGWSMPLEYAGGGVVKEHLAVRTAVGVFDVSHLGKVLVSGPGAADFLNGCLTNDLGRIAPGQAQYTLCCDDATGGAVDDLIAYLRSDSEVFLVPNAANSAAVANRLAATAPAHVRVADQHEDYAVLAVQGPRSDAVLSAVGLPTAHAYMSYAEADHVGAPVVVCRSGYTGERGYELIIPTESAGALWDALLAAGEPYAITPCGLGARDTLRTEMGYPLHGQDLSLDISPVQARLGWAVGWGKPEFWGRSQLLEQRETPPQRVLGGLVAAGRGIPRPHMQVSTEDGSVTGEITSGTFSPTLRKGVGLALVDRTLAKKSQLFVDVRGRREGFVLSQPPFVPAHVRD
jgi:aminomethyltransferase